MTDEIHLRVEFGGGAELLFGNQKKHDVALRGGHEKCTLSDLITWLKANLLKGKEELFVQGNTVDTVAHNHQQSRRTPPINTVVRKAYVALKKTKSTC
ncbi:ubiquitin-related modifier 1 isoform X3 [Dermacentor variabilis]|uniref:ubiquitin-related modifier 1 isoform X3 n=1 Tax=Dermacentor variabilis TaxID=34621 RepID=UPI003F5C6E1F